MKPNKYARVFLVLAKIKFSAATFKDLLNISPKVNSSSTFIYRHPYLFISINMYIYRVSSNCCCCCCCRNNMNNRESPKILQLGF